MLKDEFRKIDGPVGTLRSNTDQDSGQRKRTHAPPKTTLAATTSQSPVRRPAVANNTAEMRKRIQPRRWDDGTDGDASRRGSQLANTGPITLSGAKYVVAATRRLAGRVTWNRLSPLR